MKTVKKPRFRLRFAFRPSSTVTRTVNRTESSEVLKVLSGVVLEGLLTDKSLIDYCVLPHQPAIPITRLD